jgi:peptidoglycan/LPS O-acetylase OafA/YrhL
MGHGATLSAFAGSAGTISPMHTADSVVEPTTALDDPVVKRRVSLSRTCNEFAFDAAAIRGIRQLTSDKAKSGAATQLLELTRFLLSCIVLEAHIWPLHIPWLAWQSVFGFYTLSGFLMVRVLRERYGFGWWNFGLFVVNRVLRLWPAYLVLLAISAAGLAFLDIGGIYGPLRLPNGGWDTLANVTVLGLVGTNYTHEMRMSLMVPNSWSLSIEVFCYILLGLYFAKTPMRLWALGLIGVIALGWSTGDCLSQTGKLIDYGPYCFQSRYGVLEAGFIPFALGGLLQFHVARLGAVVKRWWRVIMLVIIAVTGLIASLPALQYTVGPFVGPVMVGSIVVYAADRSQTTRLTDFFGRASYHLFIAQWVLAALLVRATSLERDSFALCLATLILSLTLSGMLVPLEHRIERLRRRLAPAVFPRQEGLATDAKLITA